MSGKKEISGAASFDPTVWEIRSESKGGKLVPPPQTLLSQCLDLQAVVAGVSVCLCGVLRCDRSV